jgi:hypothetical protein
MSRGSDGSDGRWKRLVKRIYSKNPSGQKRSTRPTGLMTTHDPQSASISTRNGKVSSDFRCMTVLEGMDFGLRCLYHLVDC